MRLGLDQDEFDAAMARVDPNGLVGTEALSEGDLRSQLAEALELSPGEADELMADVWD